MAIYKIAAVPPNTATKDTINPVVVQKPRSSYWGGSFRIDFRWLPPRLLCIEIRTDEFIVNHCLITYTHIDDEFGIHKNHYYYCACCILYMMSLLSAISDCEDYRTSHCTYKNCTDRILERSGYEIISMDCDVRNNGEKMSISINPDGSKTFACKLYLGKKGGDTMTLIRAYGNSPYTARCNVWDEVYHHMSLTWD